MMEAVKKARSEQLKPYLKPGHTAIGSINSPMQCMMKGVCAECLCKHVDPHTGEEYFVNSYFGPGSGFRQGRFSQSKCTTQTKYSTGEIIQYVA
jgi:hypothetical protein